MRWLWDIVGVPRLLTTYALLLSVIVFVVMLALVFLGPVQSTYYTDGQWLMPSP